MSEFFQEAPQLGNQYDDDRVLRGWLEWRLPVLIEIASARAAQTDAREHVEAALRWCEQDLAPLPDPSRAGAPSIAAGRV